MLEAGLRNVKVKQIAEESDLRRFEFVVDAAFLLVFDVYDGDLNGW